MESVKLMLSGKHGSGVQEVVYREWLNGDESQESIRRFAVRFVKSNLKEFEGLLDKVLSKETLSERSLAAEAPGSGPGQGRFNSCRSDDSG